MNPERYMIFIPSDGSAHERMSRGDGDWIYDPDQKIDVSKYCEHETETPDTGNPVVLEGEDYHVKGLQRHGKGYYPEVK